MDLPPLIAWLYGHRAPDIKWELETMRALLRLMGDPQARLRVVLVGGTNGKGSVAAFLHAMAGEAGLRAGLFTSPHLVRPEERVRLGREDIAPDAFLERVGAMKALVEEGLAGGRLPRHPSFFEMTAALALGAMADARVDPAILEVGLGGRLDATNAADPVLSVITSVALEHTKTLGGTTAKIAAEKAGILRPGVPLVSGVTDPDARRVLEARARAIDAPLHEVPRSCTLETDPEERLDLRTPERHYRGLVLGLAGGHQRANAAVAVRAAELLCREEGLPLDEVAIRRGLASVRWPGRLETVAGRPPVILDGAHNPDGCAALARHLTGLREGRPAGGPLVLVFAAMSDKNAGAMLGALAPAADEIVVTRTVMERSADPDVLLRMARRFVPHPRAAGNTAGALEQARRAAGAEGLVVVAGSLFLVGEARGLLLGLEGAGNPPRSALASRR